MYKAQCARLLTSSSREYNATIEKLQTVDDRNTLTRQQGLLDQQAALASQHQELLVRLSNVQEDHERSKKYIEHQKKELTTVQRALQEADVNLRKTGDQAKKTQERMQRQIDLARTMLQEKVDEVEDLKEKADQKQNCSPEQSTSSSSSNEEVVHMQSEIRRRDSIQALSKFGLLPVTVLFLVKSPSQAAISFEVQFDSVREMPHTIFTFFTLVDSGLYLETTLTRHEHRISGGSPSTCVRKQAQSKLVRRMAEHGFGKEPALFTERSTKSCSAGSFGWKHKGPEFQLYLENAPEEFTCPGRIVSGLQDLRNFSLEDRITIVDARIVQSGAGTADEL